MYEAVEADTTGLQEKGLCMLLAAELVLAHGEADNDDLGVQSAGPPKYAELRATAAKARRTVRMFAAAKERAIEKAAALPQAHRAAALACARASELAAEVAAAGGVAVAVAAASAPPAADTGEQARATDGASSAASPESTGEEGGSPDGGDTTAPEQGGQAAVEGSRAEGQEPADTEGKGQKDAEGKEQQSGTQTGNGGPQSQGSEAPEKQPKGADSAATAGPHANLEVALAAARQAEEDVRAAASAERMAFKAAEAARVISERAHQAWERAQSAACADFEPPFTRTLTVPVPSSRRRAHEEYLRNSFGPTFGGFAVAVAHAHTERLTGPIMEKIHNVMPYVST